MATARESTTTPYILSGDCLIRLDGEPLHYVPVPYTALSEKLDELDRVSGNMSMFRDVRAHLDRVRIIVWYEAVYQIDCVTLSPTPTQMGWPWRCTCGEMLCWHAAFCEALEIGPGAAGR
ncbi:MAG: hypothetical protein OHK0022_38640 [Roseiflexaceae bacterium]